MTKLFPIFLTIKRHGFSQKHNEQPCPFLVTAENVKRNRDLGGERSQFDSLLACIPCDFSDV